MKYHQLQLTFIGLFLASLIFVSSYFAIFLTSEIGEIFWRDQQVVVTNSVQVVTRIANYQMQKVRFESKEIERAKTDALRLIKDTFAQRADSPLYLWIGSYADSENLDRAQTLFSSISEKEFSVLKDEIGRLEPYLEGKIPTNHKEFSIFFVRDWGWVGILGHDSQRVKNHIAQENFRIYVFFSCYVLFCVCVILLMLYLVYRDFQKVETGFNRESYIFKSSPDYLILMEPDGKIVDVGQNLLMKIRLHQNEVIGRKISDLPWWDHSLNSRNKITLALEASREKKIVNIFAQHPTGLGENIQVNHRILPLYNDQDNVAYILDWGMEADLLDQRIVHRDELNICASYFFENSSEAFLVHGVQRGIIVANCAAQRLFAVKEVAELIGNSIADFSPELQPSGEESLQLLTEAFSIAMGKGEYSLDWILHTSQGKTIATTMNLMRGVLGQDQVIYISFSIVGGEKSTSDRR